MPDAVFQNPRLVAIYDALDPDRRDLDAYVATVDEFGARSVVDLGCGTGILARMLADRGVTVTGVDPASGSLEYARTMPGADRVRWILGDATAGAVDAGGVASRGGRRGWRGDVGRADERRATDSSSRTSAAPPTVRASSAT